MGIRGENRTGGSAPAGHAGAPFSERDCETRRAIMDAARRRFLHYGYKKTTIDDIALDAGVGKGTVYLYFGNKEDILLTIAGSVKKNITEQMRAIASSLATPEEKIRRMMLAIVLSVHDAYTTTAHGVELLDTEMEQKLRKHGRCEKEIQMTLLRDVLAEGVKRGDFALRNDDAEWAAQNLYRAFAGFFPPYSQICESGDSHCRAGMQERVESMLEFVLSGIRRRNPQI